MGIESYATVKALAPSFVDTRLWDEARNGDFVKRPIIGKFEHQVGGYLRLRFDNDTTTVGVTGTHPFWSEDRHTWVKAQNLNIGENLKTQYGTAILTQRQTLEIKTTVYNLEVYQDHNYLVSEDRLLVHNNGCGEGLRNGHLAGDKHPKTGVPFDKDGYPDFKDHLYSDGPNDVNIGEFTGNRSKDFKEANKKAGYDETPDDHTWHHHQDNGRLQLVNTKIHSKTGHTGGHALNKQ